MRNSSNVILTITAFCIGIVVMNGCFALGPEPPRRHDCPSESLLVDPSIFPKGTVASSPLSGLPDGGKTSISMSIGNSEIGVTHFIYPYRTPKGAGDRFNEELDGIVENYVHMTPVDLTQLALTADRYDFRCSETETHPRCLFLAQYDNFYIELVLRTATLDTLVDVLIPPIQDIDRRMTQCFEEHPAPQD